jgi:hypothetical protein
MGDKFGTVANVLKRKTCPGGKIWAVRQDRKLRVSSLESRVIIVIGDLRRVGIEPEREHDVLSSLVMGIRSASISPPGVFMHILLPPPSGPEMHRSKV